ncbi:rhodanese-like domain-containing protein [Deinococcus aerophilus]|nr:rhodanese-like domain-containing protein [Deinococcus aerophilus]
MKRILMPLAAALTLTACTTQASDGFPTISVDQLKTAVDGGAYLLDVRTPAEFAEGHIASAINLPLDEVEARTGEVPTGRPVYVICRSGNRSAQASAVLSKAGRDVINVGGGMNDWIAAGYPVTR